MALLCKNQKPDGSWCGVPIEWREIENGKKRPFEVDTQQMHKCPYYKPKFATPPDVKQVFDKIEKEVRQAPKDPVTAKLEEIIELQNKALEKLEGIFAAVVAEFGYKKASNIKDQDLNED